MLSKQVPCGMTALKKFKQFLWHGFAQELRSSFD
jgi:hypothetical protein